MPRESDPARFGNPLRFNQTRKCSSLRAGSATAGRGGEAFVGRHRSVWVFLGPPFRGRPLFIRVGFPWILSSESILINGLRGIFRGKFFASPIWRGAETGSGGRGHSEGRDCSRGEFTSISDCQQSIVVDSVEHAKLASHPDAAQHRTFVIGLTNILLADP